MSVRFADEVELAPLAPMPQIDEVSEPVREPEPERRSGFDPALLNPASPVDTRHAIAIDPPDNPFTYSSVPAAPQPEPTSLTNGNGLPSNAQVVLDNDLSMHTADSQPAEPSSQADQPMEIEREPTPLPDFFLDEVMLEDLKVYVRDRTAALSVEQLEQLRATCLGLVWRHRQDWDRTGLLQELKQEAQTFVEEVALDEMGADSP